MRNRGRVSGLQAALSGSNPKAPGFAGGYLLAVLSANVFAVLPSMNPPQLNPMPSVANAPRAAPPLALVNEIVVKL